MKATYQTANPGNRAIEAQIFSIPVAAARLVVKELRCEPGTYWEAKVLKPMRRAIRAKLDSFSVSVGGFSTGELANALRSVGCEVEFTGNI